MTVPLDNLTLATFRSPELGFLGFVMPTRTQTPFISGRPTMAGERARRAFCPWRQPRITWFRVALRDVVVLNVRRGVGRVGRRKRVDVVRRADGRPRKRARKGEGILAVVS